MSNSSQEHQPIRAALRIVAGGSVGNAFIIGPSEYSIGRSSGGWVQLRRATVSRRQCLVSFDTTNGKHILSDHGSTNRTLLNGVELSEHTPLATGDLITLGDLVLEYLEVAPQGARVDTEIRDLAQNSVPTIEILGDANQNQRSTNPNPEDEG